MSGVRATTARQHTQQRRPTTYSSGTPACTSSTIATAKASLSWYWIKSWPDSVWPATTGDGRSLATFHLRKNAGSSSVTHTHTGFGNHFLSLATLTRHCTAWNTPRLVSTRTDHTHTHTCATGSRRGNAQPSVMVGKSAGSTAALPWRGRCALPGDVDRVSEPDPSSTPGLSPSCACSRSHASRSAASRARSSCAARRARAMRSARSGSSLDDRRRRPSALGSGCTPSPNLRVDNTHSRATHRRR